ncbi:hypothetical protein PT287_08415 [Lactobacillus sp. ESL0679]|uniref:phage tail terminator family protein n=1 Tax=Lactobacillus sp. ESL0679 TaxID=2983209 RepID=UPI0023F81F79|nr:hypothetical protein [Lactobacillus sp. ESL0679]MDF7683521.1 hypothetical protein [Lactobacillus sp. ESL0679]
MTITERIANEIAVIFPDAVIYTENQDSGFEQPSFFIQKILTATTPLLFENQDRKYYYQIVYFPNLDHPNADMERVEDKLLDNFTQLSGFADIHNREFDIDIANTVLEVKFEVWTWAIKQDTTIKQRKVDVNGGVKD